VSSSIISTLGRREDVLPITWHSRNTNGAVLGRLMEWPKRQSSQGCVAGACRYSLRYWSIVPGWAWRRC